MADGANPRLAAWHWMMRPILAGWSVGLRFLFQSGKMTLRRALPCHGAADLRTGSIHLSRHASMRASAAADSVTPSPISSFARRRTSGHRGRPVPCGQWRQAISPRYQVAYLDPTAVPGSPGHSCPSHPWPGLQHGSRQGSHPLTSSPMPVMRGRPGLAALPGPGARLHGLAGVPYAHMPPPHVGDGAHSSAKYGTDNPTRRRFSPERGIDIDSSARAQWHPRWLRARWLAPSFPAKGRHWPPTRALRSSCAAKRNKDP